MQHRVFVKKYHHYSAKKGTAALCVFKAQLEEGGASGAHFQD